jgi:hypothetical protein
MSTPRRKHTTPQRQQAIPIALVRPSGGCKPLFALLTIAVQSSGTDASEVRGFASRLVQQYTGQTRRERPIGVESPPRTLRNDVPTLPPSWAPTPRAARLPIDAGSVASSVGWSPPSPALSLPPPPPPPMPRPVARGPTETPGSSNGSSPASEISKRTIEAKIHSSKYKRLLSMMYPGVSVDQIVQAVGSSVAANPASLEHMLVLAAREQVALAQTKTRADEHSESLAVQRSLSTMLHASRPPAPGGRGRSPPRPQPGPTVQRRELPVRPTTVPVSTVAAVSLPLAAGPSTRSAPATALPSVGKPEKPGRARPPSSSNAIAAPRTSPIKAVPKASAIVPATSPVRKPEVVISKPKAKPPLEPTVSSPSDLHVLKKKQQQYAAYVQEALKDGFAVSDAFDKRQTRWHIPSHWQAVQRARRKSFDAYRREQQSACFYSGETRYAEEHVHAHSDMPSQDPMLDMATAEHHEVTRQEVAEYRRLAVNDAIQRSKFDCGSVEPHRVGYYVGGVFGGQPLVQISERSKRMRRMSATQWELGRRILSDDVLANSKPVRVTASGELVAAGRESGVSLKDAQGVRGRAVRKVLSHTRSYSVDGGSPFWVAEAANDGRRGHGMALTVDHSTRASHGVELTSAQWNQCAASGAPLLVALPGDPVHASSPRGASEIQRRILPGSGGYRSRQFAVSRVSLNDQQFPTHTLAEQVHKALPNHAGYSSVHKVKHPEVAMIRDDVPSVRPAGAARSRLIGWSPPSVDARSVVSSTSSPPPVDRILSLPAPRPASPPPPPPPPPRRRRGSSSGHSLS